MMEEPYQIIPRKKKAKKGLTFRVTKPLQAKLEETERLLLQELGGKLPSNYHIISDPKELGLIARKITEKQAFAFDTETSGLHPWKDTLYCISFWVGDEGYLCNFEHPGLPTVTKQQVKDVLGSYFKDPKIKRIGFNYIFDACMLEQQASIDCGYCFLDGYVGSWSLDENLPTAYRKLKPLSERWLGEKTLGTYEQAFNNLAWIKIPPTLAAYYAIKDSYLHMKLARYEEVELRKIPELHKLVHTHDIPAMNILLDVRRNGIKVNKNKLFSIHKRVSSEINEIESKLNSYVPADHDPVNWSSPTQVGDIFYNVLGLRDTKEGAVNTYAREEIIGDHPIVKLYDDFSKVEKRLEFLESIYEQSVDGIDGMTIHPSFKSVGTSTFRMSSQDPNYQNIPNRGEHGAEIRTIHYVEDDYYMVSIDLAGQELRLQGAIAGDEELVKSAITGTYYSDVAALIYGGKASDYPKHGPGSEKRDKSKAFCLARGYGGKTKKLSRTLGVSLEETKKAEDACDKKYWKYTLWENRIKQESHQNGYVKYFTGRIRRIDYKKLDPDDKKY